MGGLGQVGYGPPERIDGPPPIRPLYGLLQAAEAPAAGVRLVVDTDQGPLDENDRADLESWGIPRPGEERWLNGVEVFPYPPDLADVFDPCAPGSSATTKGFGTNPVHPLFGAMTIWLAETCTAARVWNQEQYKARALVALAAVEGAAIAKEFMAGLRMPNTPHLSDGGGTFPNGNTAISVKLGLALLEDEIGKSGRFGLIHCSPGIATLLRENFALDNKTGVWRTVNGTVVIPDAGYVNPPIPVGRSGGGGNQEWMYATGPVDIRRSEMFVTPDTVEDALDLGAGTTGATNNRPNAITYRAERYYLVDWDKTMQAAVLVDRTL